QAAMISVPPEMWVKVGRFGLNRLGRADTLGVSSGYPGEGTGLVSDTVASITGEPVHAVIRMDEDTLASTIDSLGGVHVNVTKRFYEWRVRKRFGVGIRHLNGERAKWFISPYVGGPQGKPEARERRQQQLLLAMLTKLREAPPQVRERFAKMHCAHDGRVTAETNLTARELDQFLGALRQTPTVRQVTLTHVLEPFEVQAMHDRGEALRPRDNDYAAVRDIVHGAFEQGQTTAAIAAK
ncbi:MAG TPA: LCP family protein, partial [Vicinamibacterales bacterium]|nr:LCP family protein [Vicinamibacterales bacterium]